MRWTVGEGTVGDACPYSYVLYIRIRMKVMKMSELKKRKTPRCKGFDYNSVGAYFITICTQDRRCVLSHPRSTDHCRDRRPRLSAPHPRSTDHCRDRHPRRSVPIQRRTERCRDRRPRLSAPLSAPHPRSIDNCGDRRPRLSAPSPSNKQCTP